MQWLPDTIRALAEFIDKVGLNALTVVSCIAAVGLLCWYMKKLIEDRSTMQSGVIHANTQGMSVNTSSNVTLTEAVRAMAAKWDSEKMNALCRSHEMKCEASRLGITQEKFQELLDRIHDLQVQGKAAAAEIKKKESGS